MYKKVFLSKIIVISTIISLLLFPFAYLDIFNVNATVSSISMSGTDFTASSIDISTTTTGTATLNFTLGTAIAADDTIVITLNGFHPQTDALAVGDLTFSGQDGTACATSTLVAGAPSAGQIGVTFSNNVADTDNPVITLTLASSGVDCATGATTLVFATGSIESSDTAGNYGITIVTSEEVGAGFVYVGDENDVQVTAQVDPTFSFEIRTSTDSAALANVDGGAVGPNLCDLGTLPTSATVATCAYRLKVATNAVSGYTVNIAVDDDLNNAGDTEFIDNVTEDTTVSAGTEGYGIALTAGSATDGTITEAGDFSDDDTPIGTGTNTTLYSSDGPNNPVEPDLTNTALVTHRAAADAATPAGNYTQLVTYTVTPSF